MRSWALAIVLICLLVPTQGVVGAGETGDQLQITVENPTPPARTTLAHEITIQPAPNANSTSLSVEFPDRYVDSTLLVDQVTTGDGTILSHKRIDGPDDDGINETIQIDLQGPNVSEVSVTATLGHPPRSSGRSFAVVARSGSHTATDTYTLQPIGETSRSGPTGSFDRVNGAGFIYDGATVFRGEQDISFRGQLEHQLLGTGGSAAGVPLGTPIPTDRPTGRYAVDGTNQTASVSVVDPRISTFEVRNERGEKINGGVVPTERSVTLTVVAQSNFDVAEQLSLTVRDQRGLDITDAVTDRSTKPEGTDGTARWTLNISVTDGTEYTIAVEGADDLTTDNARQQTQVRLTSRDPSLQLERPIVSRGERVTIQYTGAQAGSERFVTVDEAVLRETASLTTLQATFRSIENVQSTGFIMDDGTVVTNPDTVDRDNIARVFARVEMAEADGSETLQVQTSAVETQRLPIALHTKEATVEEIGAGRAVVDTVSVFVIDAETDLTAPQSYIVGAETTVQGQTTPGIRQVALYVRDGEQYQLVDLDGQNDAVDATIDVADDTYTRKEVVLSSGDTAGNRVLSLPGMYRVGIVTLDPSESPPRTLNQTAFASRTSDLQRLHVTDGSVQLTVQTRNGEISTLRSEIQVSGTAPGAEAVGLVLVGSRGTVRHDKATVTDGEYNESVRLGSLSRGSIRVYAITTGRDGVLGDGTIPVAGEPRKATLGTFETYIGTPDNQLVRQIGQRIAAETVGDTASDDGYRIQLIRRTSPEITVDTVRQGGNASVRAGTEIAVGGQTNVDPANGVIRVSLRRNGLEIADARVGSWGATWKATLNVPTEAAGPYTIRAELEDSVDYRMIQIQPASNTTVAPSASQASRRSVQPAEHTAEPSPASSSRDSMTQRAAPPNSGSRAGSTSDTSPGYVLGSVLIGAGVMVYVLARRRERR